MINKKLRLWKKAMAFVLSFMLLIPSVALAKDTEGLPDVSGTEIVQVDLNAEIEKALQESGMSENETADGTDIFLGEDKDIISENDNTEIDEGISGTNIVDTEDIVSGEENVSDEDANIDTGENQEDIDLQGEISARGVSMPVTELYITQVRGKVNGLDREEIIKNCGQDLHIASDASAEAKTVFDRDTIRITMQYIGTHLAYQKQTASGDVHMTASGIYDATTNGSGAATSFKIDYILTPRDQDVKQTVFEFVYRPYHADGNNYYPEIYYRRLTVNWGESADAGAAPTTPEYTFDKATPDQYVITGVTSAMEYRLEGAQEWTDCPDGQFLVDIPYSEKTTIYVRYKGENTQSKGIVLPPRPAAPKFTYDKMHELLLPCPTSDVEYILGDGTEFADFSEEIMQTGNITEMINSLPTGYWSRLRIRNKATDTQPASQEFRDIRIYYRVDMRPIAFNENTCVFTMPEASFFHYKIIAGDIETEWRAFANKEYSIDSAIFEDRDNTILVRKEATSSQCAHSLPVKFFVPKRVEGCKNVTLDYLNEQLVGFETGKNYEYRIGKTASWRAITVNNGVFPVSWALGEKEADLYIREKGTSTTPPSAGKLFALPARSAAPTGIAVKYNVAGYEDKACAIGVQDNQQYSTDSGKTWKDCTGGFVPLNDSVKAYFRNKSTPTAFASLNTFIQVPARGGAPTVSYNQSTECLTLVKPTMEYSTGNEYMPVTGDYVDLSSYIDELTSNSYVWVRYQGTEDKPSSRVKNYRVYKRAAAPATVTFDAATSTLSGVTYKMQYKIGDNGTWINIPNSNPIDLSSYASATENLKIYVRMKYVNNSSAASKSVEFVLPKK